MSSKAHSVKKHTAIFLGALALSVSAIAPNAYAYDGLLKDTVVTVKFNMTELEAENGTAKVYAKLKKRARSFCKADHSALYYLRETLSDCQADLLKQFLNSADIDALTAYHLSKGANLAVDKYTLNSN